jgi:hypothetical protein
MSGTLTYGAPPVAHNGASAPRLRNTHRGRHLAEPLRSPLTASRRVALVPRAVTDIPRCTQLGPDPEPAGSRAPAFRFRISDSVPLPGGP